MSVPRLRFKEFGGDWEATTLGKESVCLDNKRVPLEQSDRAQRAGPYPYYGASGIIDYIDDYLFDETLVLLGEDGANIINRNSPLAFLAKGKFWVNNHAHVYRAKGSFEFLATYLENLRYEKYNTGTAQPKLNGEVCKKLKLNFPTLPEQKKIASFLGVVDAKIAALRARVLGLQGYKRGLMQALFSQTLRFTQKDGTAFPSWEEKRLGEVFSEVKDRVGDSDLPTFSISAGRGFISQEERFGKDISGQQNERYTALKMGDFSYNKGNSITYKYGCIYENKTGATIAVPNVFISFRLRNRKMSADFFGKLFEDHHMDKGLRTLISSGARMNGLLNVNKDSFFKLTIPVPHPDEQAKIAEALSAMDAKIAGVQDQVSKMQDFKKGLLQQMFV